MEPAPDLREVAKRFQRVAPPSDHCTLRIVEESSIWTSVRRDVPEPVARSTDLGAMVTVVSADGVGYAATSDLSEAGLKGAADRAAQWARAARGRSVFDGVTPRLTVAGQSLSNGALDPDWTLAERFDLLRQESAQCRVDDRIVDWQASLWTVRSRQVLAAAGGEPIFEEHAFAIPALHVAASQRERTQVRSWGGRHNGLCQQGSARHVVERSGFAGSGLTTAQQALQLLAAPNCPSGTLDLLLMPDQMMLQIHESIGHPLELDRILGDERNYAGTSFVTPDMFGSYRYGSELLNVTYDPTRSEEFATFAYDDQGSRARREYLIRDGILIQPLGGTLSRQRLPQAKWDGFVATSRASSWNRPPIDRMSNLNVEAGTSTFEQMVASIEDGILMRTNASWSIDDSRNKFQFGCEWGQRIRSGRLAEVVRNPNYRGISATFWRSLAMVGDASTVEVLGSPYCGKGEPNQLIRVGHASPACKFAAVAVFGAET
ncbi:MAG TPA: TldD/PmbA family protein [Burkholderiaceae bacterium]|nr:TldD/PmbA family protein [Burkholderiaceae bacterium]